MSNAVMSQDQLAYFSEEQKKLIKSTICPGATDQELALFAEICKQTKLNPFTRQIYAQKRRSKDQRTQQWVEKWSFETSIDGARVVAERSGEYEGQVGPQWCGQDGVWCDVWLSKEPPKAARVGVWKKGFREPTWGTARWDEYVQVTKDGEPTSMWRKMPASQLAKCAEMLALRKGFPNDLSGVYAPEEMAQSENPQIGPGENTSIRAQRDGEPEVLAAAKPPTDLRARLTGNVVPKTTQHVGEVLAAVKSAASQAIERHLEVMVDEVRGMAALPSEAVEPEVKVAPSILSGRFDPNSIHGEYLVSFGKYTGKRLKEIPQKDLAEYYWVIAPKIKTASDPAAAKALAEKIDAYLNNK